MEIRFAGVGNSSTTQDYYQSSFVLAHNNKNMLVDCGTDARFSLAELGVTNDNVGLLFDAIYITHIHSDHCGGLEWLAFCIYFNRFKSKLPMLIVNQKVLDDLEIIMGPGLNSIKGIKADLSHFFNVTPVEDFFEWSGIEFNLVEGQHVWSNNTYMPMYGLYMVPDKCDDKGVFFSGDTIITQLGCDIMENASLIFHDCETREEPSGVHANYNDLKQLPFHIRQKTWLYHYGPNPIQNPKSDGFCGWVSKGDVFDK